MEIESDIFDDLSDLCLAKDNAFTDRGKANARRNIVRNFVNLMPTMTAEEAEEKGRTEITNFGRVFRQATAYINPLENLVIGTNNLARISVDNDDPTRDALLSTDISNAFNKAFINTSEKFSSLWRSVVGEGYVSGAVPLVYEYADEGVYPSVKPNMVFPRNTPLDSEKIAYAFDYVPMSADDLQMILDTTDKDDPNVNREGIKGLIKKLRGAIREHSELNHESSNHPLADKPTESVRDEECPAPDVTHLKAYKYWEVRRKDDGHKYVSFVLFLDNISGNEADKTDKEMKDYEERLVIMQESETSNDPSKWLMWMIFDEEIGGVKNYDTARGIAEANYPAAREIEELANLELEGAKIRARPKLLYNEDIDPDEILDLDLTRDVWFPNKLEEFEFRTGNSELRPILSDLLQTTAGISATTHSNTGRDQELRTQSVARQQQNASVVNTRVNKAYKKLDQLLDLMVERALSIDPDPGDDDYKAVMWFQTQVDKAIQKHYELEEGEAKKQRKKISEKNHGFYTYLCVSARRTATGVDRPTEVDNARFLMEMVDTGRVSPQLVPSVLTAAAATFTQNTDIAELLSQDTRPVIKEQGRIALYEWEAILNSATTGEPLPTNSDDSHPDHVDVHTRNLASFVNGHQLRPWDQLSVAQFAAVVEHVGEHLALMRDRPEFKGEAERLLPPFQEVVNQGAIIAQEVEEAIAQEAPDDEDVDKLLKMSQIQYNTARIEKLANDIARDNLNTVGTQQQRSRRDAQAEERLRMDKRSRAVQEIKDDREFRANQRETE